MAWDWWNENNVYGVDFKAGINTQTYKYYIDFAAKYGIPVHHPGRRLVQAWQCTGRRAGNKYGRVERLRETKKCWRDSVGGMENAGRSAGTGAGSISKWGVKGIKVDFMQRSDEMLINYYHKVSRETAKRKMLVDFHGDQKPATMTRTWPNLISTEGVRGMEWSKWSAETDPQHNVTLPFTRMFLGPMDYTPGAMLNAHED